MRSIWRKATGWRLGWVALAAVLCVLQAVPGGFGPGSPGGPVPAAAADGETRRASSRTTYSCPSPPSGYQYSRRVGRTCYYTKTRTITSTATSRTSHSCASTYRGYRLSYRLGRTCYYTKTQTITSTARSRTTYSCASTYRGYRLSHRRGRVCYYSKTYTTTRSAYFNQGLRRFTCPSTHRGYRYSHLSGRVCHYSRTLSTTAVARSETTTSCPSVHRVYVTYLYSHRNGSICYYSRTLNQTRPARVRTTYSCPSAPANHRFSRRSGSTCYYTPTTTTTTTTTPSTTTTTTTPTSATTTTQAVITTTPAGTTTTPAGTTTTPAGTTTIPPGSPSGSSTRTIRTNALMPVPEGLEANGDSPLQSKGQSIIKWATVTGTYRHYEIQYREVQVSTTTPISVIPVPVRTLSSDPKDGKWKNKFATNYSQSPFPSTGKLSVTLLLPYVMVLYEVRIRTVTTNGNIVSAWSPSIYTYPTRDPVPKHSLPIRDISTEIKPIGIVRVAGFRDAYTGNSIHPANAVGEYSYVICAEDIPTTNGSTMVAAIEAGINIWTTVTGNMVQSTHHRKNGNLRNCDDNDGVLLRNKIRPLSTKQLEDQFGLSEDEARGYGKVVHNPVPHISVNGRIETTDMYFDRSASTNIGSATQSPQCSKMMRIVMHEAAHALALPMMP